MDRLSQATKKYMTDIEYVVVDCHPKRPDPQQLARFETEINDADIWESQYYRTSEMLLERYPELESKKKILVHNNPYAIHEGDWNHYNMVVANNDSIYKELSQITTAPLEKVPLAVDHKQWTLSDKPRNNKINMVANRIEGKKGILPAAKACKKLGLTMILVGNISDMNYFNEVMSVGSVQFAQNISDDELRETYQTTALHVCNSQDNFESGTLPILESTMCGQQVLTRAVGHVPDFGLDNFHIYEGDNEDVDGLADAIDKALNSEPKDNWNAVKYANHDVRAYRYRTLYHKLLQDNKTVSVIMPTTEDNPENAAALDKQTYGYVEKLIAVDTQPGYNLAKVRNEAAINATGEILVFCDDRMKLEEDAVEQFVKNLKPGYWLYGNKGVKKDFVENVSCIYREDFMKFGMFNERMDAYGGLSQETRSRARKQGIKLEYVESAKATPTRSSRNRREKKLQTIEMKNKLWKMGLL